MRRLILKIIYVLAVFFLALFLFLHFSEREKSDQTTVMGAARLPVIRLTLPGDVRQTALLHGYVDGDMDIRSMRGGVLPVGEDRTVHLYVSTFGEALDGITFEVRDITGENLVEQGEVTERVETAYGDIDASFTVKDLMEKNTDYMLVIRLSSALGPVSYYTRIEPVETETLDFVKEAMDFALEFREITFDESRKSELTRYLESDRTGDNTSFAYANIHSSLSHVTWRDLPVLSHDAATVELVECDGDIVNLNLEAQMVTEGENEGDRRNVFDTKETFRIRKGKDRLYLLDYERTMTRRFSGSSADFGEDHIELGIGPEKFPFIENDDGSVLAFAAGDKLFSYSKSENELTQLFSFADSENADERCTWQAHDYHLLRVDENGDVRFLVAGYMNRGQHEGRVGVAFYRYDAGIRQLEELAFVPADVSPEILRAYIRRLAHVSSRDELYLMLADDVVIVDPSDNSVRTLVKDASKRPYYLSASGALFARVDEDGAHLEITQFHSGNTVTVDADPGTRVIPLGFMQEDLVYGVCADEDVRRDQAGKEVYAMRTVRIMDANGHILENYSSEGNYVVSARTEGNQIFLSRVRLNDATGFYEETTADQIINTLEAKSNVNRVVTTAKERYKKTVKIDLRQEVNAASVRVLSPRFVLDQDKEEPGVVRQHPSEDCFLVYAQNGSVEGLYADEGDAVIAADAQGAIVVDGDDRTVWVRRTLLARNQIMSVTRAAEDMVLSPETESAAACLQLMLEQRGINRDVSEMLDGGASFKEVLSAGLTDCHALSLTGCSLTAMLMYVNQDIPVLGSLNDGSAMLVIGFNDTEVVLVDPMKPAGERVYKVTRSQAARLFDDSGNRFTTYYQR